MSEYVGLRVKGVVKEECRNLVNELMYGDYNVAEMYAMNPEYECLKGLSESWISDSFPWIPLTCMPDSWDGEFRTDYDERSGDCSIVFSTTNRHDEINIVVDELLPFIFDEAYIEVLHEYSGRGVIYQIENGRCVPNGEIKEYG